MLFYLSNTPWWYIFENQKGRLLEGYFMFKNRNVHLFNGILMKMVNKSRPIQFGC